MAIVVQSGFESGSINDLPKKPFRWKPAKPHPLAACPNCGQPKPEALYMEFEPVKQVRCEKCLPKEPWL